MGRWTLSSALPAAACVVAGCAAPVPVPVAEPVPLHSYLVLLPEEDGRTGRVVFTGTHGTVEVQQAQQPISLLTPLAAFTVDDAQFRRDTQAVIAAQPRLPRTFIFYFETRDARITKNSEPLVAQLQDELRARQAPDVSITGHTDTAGEAARNAVLAQRRAQHVAQILKPFTASALGVEVGSHGESNPLVPTADGVDEPRNRRVEVVVR